MHDILTPPTDSGCSKLSPILPYRPGPLFGKLSHSSVRHGGHHTTQRCAE